MLDVTIVLTVVGVFVGMCIVSFLGTLIGEKDNARLDSYKNKRRRNE